MKELVQYIAENLVDDVDKVRVKDIRTSQGIVLELRVSRQDMGRVIGAEGRVANAIARGFARARNAPRQAGFTRDQLGICPSLTP